VNEGSFVLTRGDAHTYRQGVGYERSSKGKMNIETLKILGFCIIVLVYTGFIMKLVVDILFLRMRDRDDS